MARGVVFGAASIMSVSCGRPGYGQVLLIKLVLVAAALAIANRARRKHLLRVGQRPGQLHLTTRIELAVVTAVVAVRR